MFVKSQLFVKGPAICHFPIFAFHPGIQKTGRREIYYLKNMSSFAQYSIFCPLVSCTVFKQVLLLSLANVLTVTVHRGQARRTVIDLEEVSEPLMKSKRSDWQTCLTQHSVNTHILSNTGREI